MIEIKDNDLPITAAYKIITGVKPSCSTDAMKQLVKGLTGVDPEEQTIDMFSLEEIREIGLYLLTYYETHEERGD